MNILIVSPSFIPMAGVGKMRMASLVKHLREKHSVTVIQSRISSYDEITEEQPLDNVKIVEADVQGSFSADGKAFEKALKEEFTDSSYDVVLITVGPYYTLPLTKLVKKIAGIPVIVDYRDLWTNSYRDHEAKATLKKKIKTYGIERPALKYVDGYTSCDERSVDVLKKQYPFLQNVMSQHIFNGYDDAELKDVIVDPDRKYKEGKTTIGIYGKFDYYIGYDNVHWFVEELEKLVEERQEKIRIIHYGRREEYFENLLKDTKIEYDWRGFVEYKTGMNALAEEADLLVAANDVLIGFGTKVFDYIYLNKPILMFAVEGSDLKTFVPSFENGYAFTTREELQAILAEIMEKRPSSLAENMNPGIYGRAGQNRKFEEFIQQVANRG